MCLFTVAGTTFIHKLSEPVLAVVLTLSGRWKQFQWVSGALTLKIKRPTREAYHSLQSSAKVKNAWSSTSSPEVLIALWLLYVIMAWNLVKYRDTFTFTFGSVFFFVQSYYITIFSGTRRIQWVEYIRKKNGAMWLWESNTIDLTVYSMFKGPQEARTGKIRLTDLWVCL